MPRRPEIGNVQLYPNRPLQKSDRNGYQLKFYCPILRKRVRKNCGTRDRREARSILRECRERLLNGEYARSGGVIAAKLVTELETVSVATTAAASTSDSGMSWEIACERFKAFKSKRCKHGSLVHLTSRLSIAERIFNGYRQDDDLPLGFSVREVMTLDMLEYLQERLLEGDECRYETRSPNSVNSLMCTVMTFVRFCCKREWIDRVPDIERLEVAEVMKGRPISAEEFERMLKATPQVVGPSVMESWKFALRVLWLTGFRVADLLDFSWDDDRHIRPHWPKGRGLLPSIAIPSSQKNGRIEEIPMLDELDQLLSTVPKGQRQGWIVNPQWVERPVKPGVQWFQPNDDDLRELVTKYSNLSIAQACGESEATIRKWLKAAGIERPGKIQSDFLPEDEVVKLRERAIRSSGAMVGSQTERMTKERVSRIISQIGKAAGIIVRQDDPRTGSRLKYASAHDIRRGYAKRLIDAGVSAETVKVVMRHKDFATTEKHYGAIRSTQVAAEEVRQKLSPTTGSDRLVGGLMGGQTKTPQLTAEELAKLKSLLETI